MSVMELLDLICNPAQIQQAAGKVVQALPSLAWLTPT